MSESGEASTGPARGGMQAALRWSLPFSRQAWRGNAGNWMGTGTGSSIDFQDHRHYVPGDDPRHIHWQAYARSGTLTMKLYREEVSPYVDVAVDVSASMDIEPAKRARTDDLVAFCVTSAERAGASCRVTAGCGRRMFAVANEDVRRGNWRDRIQPEAGQGQPPGPFAWRPRAMRVLVSDLLYPTEPAAYLPTLCGGSGTTLILAPSLESEETLDHRGNVELVDCERQALRRQRIDDGLARRYATAYARHFSLWREACRRRGVLFARVPCNGELVHALSGEACASGTVEAVA